MKGVDLRFAFVLGLPGGFIALATLTGWFGSAVEFSLWTLLAVALWVPAAVMRAPERPLLTLTVAGLVAGILTALVHATLTPTLLANNATYAATYATADVATRGALAGFALMIGVFWGVLFGLVAWGIVAWRARGRSAPASAP